MSKGWFVTDPELCDLFPQHRGEKSVFSTNRGWISFRLTATPLLLARHKHTHIKKNIFVLLHWECTIELFLSRFIFLSNLYFYRGQAESMKQYPSIYSLVCLQCQWEFLHQYLNCWYINVQFNTIALFYSHLKCEYIAWKSWATWDQRWLEVKTESAVRDSENNEFQ